MTETIDPKAVEAFLLAHPDFLQDRPALLAALNLPHGGPGAVSLVERQVALLRERNIASRQRLNELTELGKENDRLLNATRTTILSLLQSGSADEVVRIWCNEATETFGAEMATLIWFDGSGFTAEDATHSGQAVALRLISGSNSQSGVVRAEEMQALFGIDGVDGSAALAAISRGDKPIGVLAVGSTDPDRYRPEDGTLFLDYLGEVIAQLPACQ